MQRRCGWRCPAQEFHPCHRMTTMRPIVVARPIADYDTCGLSREIENKQYERSEKDSVS